jgi:hypothetical protein
MAVGAEKIARVRAESGSDSTLINGKLPGLLETKLLIVACGVFIGFKSPSLPLECSHYTFRDFNFLLIIINKAAWMWRISKKRASGTNIPSKTPPPDHPNGLVRRPGCWDAALIMGRQFWEGHYRWKRR